MTFPDHKTQTSLYLDQNASATCVHYRGQLYSAAPEGEFTFTVTDRDGHSYTTRESLTTKITGTAAPSNNLDTFGAAVWQAPHPDTDAPF